MKEILIHLRAMNLFGHSAHLLCGRVAFHSDHAFFGEAYEKASDDYDSVAERTIGLFGEEQLQLQMILQGAAAKLQAAPSVGVKENATFYQYLLQMEMELCKLCAIGVAQAQSEGVKQLLGEICNQSESMQYKIKQRLKK